MTAFSLLILSLATWRAARLLTQEAGPFALIARLRARVAGDSDEALMTCIYCMSVWAAAGAYLLWHFEVPYILEVGAIAGAAMLLHRHTGGNHL